IDDEDYLVLGRGNAYSVEKDAINRVETFCLFFSSEMMNEVAGSLLRRDGHGLDDPFTPLRFDVYEHRRSHGGPLSRRLLSLRRSYHRGELTNDLLEEQLLLLASGIVRQHHAINRTIARLPWERQTTRIELYRRVHIGRDYIHAHLDEAFSLEDAARASALSRYHFLRAFHRIIGQTPLSYLNDLRVTRAKLLLEDPNLSVTHIGLAVGYSSVAAFSTFFKKSVGVSPLKWRNTARDKQYR
ncbi:MAG: AraC family transcriptional regulator, partial [Myxococcota bacterium]